MPVEMPVDWTKRPIAVPGLFDSHEHAYEHCVVASPPVFVAGQVGWDAERRIVSAEFEPQARQAFENLRSALRAAGTDLAGLVSMTVFVTDARYGPEFLRVRKDVLGRDYSTSALITVNQLFDPRLLVEIQAVAVRPVPSAPPGL